MDILLFSFNLFLFLLPPSSPLLDSFQDLLPLRQILHFHGFLKIGFSLFVLLSIPCLSFLLSLFEQFPLLMHIPNIIFGYFCLLRVQRIVAGVDTLGKLFLYLNLELFFFRRDSIPIFNYFKVRHLFVKDFHFGPQLSLFNFDHPGHIELSHEFKLSLVRYTLLS